MEKTKIVAKSNWISLSIILIVGFLTLQVGQGQALIIDLLHHQPANLILFFLQVLFLSIIIAHFPIYLEFYFNKAADNFEWTLYNPKLWGIGFITFIPKENGEQYEPIDLGWIRKLLGLAFFSYIFNVFSETFRIQIANYSSNYTFLPEFVHEHAFWVAFILSSVIFFVSQLFIKRDISKRIFFRSSFIVGVIFLGISAYYSNRSGWSLGSIRLSVFALFTVCLFYIFLVLFRKATFFGNHLYHLYLIAAFGLLNLVILIVANFQASLFNPIVLILSVLILLYGLTIIILKHRFYYEQERKPRLTAFFFRQVAPFLILLIPCWYFLAEKIGNDLHTLEPIKQNESIDYNQYKTLFENHFKDKETLYFIAAYGGGLKANLWNQLVLDTLQNYRGQNIIEQTVAISGVSGGALGNAMYAAIQQEVLPKDRKRKIEEIGNGNFLSIDLAYMFGHDFLGNLFGTALLSKKNRAYKSMELYQKIILDNKSEKLLNRTFQSYWAELNSKGHYYPTLIFNSSGKHEKKGVVCSIVMSDSIFNDCFHNSENLLNIGSGMSLSFLEATSTSNRFPIISPAAKIAGKGHFVDGGYFENSGMLSLMDFYNYLKKEGLLKDKKIRIIQISNDLGVSVNNLFAGQKIEKTIKESGEFSSMLGAKIGLNFLPYYFSEWIEKNEDLEIIRIDMPHYIHPGDLNKLFDTEKLSIQEELKDIIENNNSNISHFRSKDPFAYIEPPLSRMLGEQSLNYMKKVITLGLPFAELDSKINP